MSEKTLFPESEIFTKARPLKLTIKLENDFWLRMAKEVIIETWCSEQENIEDIVSDLSELSMSDSGYEMAKDLENGKCDWEIDSELIAFLENLSWGKIDEYKKLVKEWVTIHNPQPIFSIGTKLMVEAGLNSKIKTGQTIWITGINKDTAEYLYWDDPNHNGGYVKTYEQIEGSCTIII